MTKTKAIITIDQLADYLIWKSLEGNDSLNLLKLQKLAYYSQAWHLALEKSPLVAEKFQAWVHGPVSRTLFDRFGSNGLYDTVTTEKLTKGFEPASLPASAIEFINSVLEEYGKFSGSQLEAMTHREDPWVVARKGYSSTQRCEVEIDESLMASYYSARTTVHGS